jgi:hypothetical protein
MDDAMLVDPTPEFTIRNIAYESVPWRSFIVHDIVHDTWWPEIEPVGMAIDQIIYHSGI